MTLNCFFIIIKKSYLQPQQNMFFIRNDTNKSGSSVCKNIEGCNNLEYLISDIVSHFQNTTPLLIRKVLKDLPNPSCT